MKTKNCWNCIHNTGGRTPTPEAKVSQALFTCSIKDEHEDCGESCESYEMELFTALDNIKTGYDAFYIENKYGDGTHKTEFGLLIDHFKNDDLGLRGLNWIKNCYDCHYKGDYPTNTDDPKANPFSYLTDRLNYTKEDKLGGLTANEIVEKIKKREV